MTVQATAGEMPAWKAVQVAAACRETLDLLREINENSSPRCLRALLGPNEDRKAVLESIRYVDEAFPETSWEQKSNDIEAFSADVFVTGDDRAGNFDQLSAFCEVTYLPPKAGISTSEMRHTPGPDSPMTAEARTGRRE